MTHHLAGPLRQALPIAVVGSLLLPLAACSGDGPAASAASSAVSTVVCAAVRPVATTIGNGLEALVGQISLDPSGVVSTLESWQSSLSTVTSNVSAPAPVQSALETVTGGVEDLLALAQKGAAGTEVTESDTRAARERIDEAVASLTSACG